MPRLPFSRAVRPNSDMVRSDDIVHAVAEVSIERGQTVANSLSRLASWPVAPPSLAWVSQPPISVKATSNADIGFDQTGDLRKTIAKTAAG